MPAAARIKALAAAGAGELASVIMGWVSLCSGSILEAPTVVSCFEDMTVVGEPTCDGGGKNGSSTARSASVKSLGKASRARA